MNLKEAKTSKNIKYDEFIYGFNNVGYLTTRIIDWEFIEKEDPSREWITDPIKRLMMYRVINTVSGTFTDDFLYQYGELMRIITKELLLNLKYQHGVTK